MELQGYNETACEGHPLYRSFFPVMMDIESFWKDVLHQRREALRAYFADDAVIRWHCSNEQFTADEYVRANCDYPGEWDGTIERIDIIENGYVTAVKVYPPDHSAHFHVVSFIHVKDGLVTSLDEYWADDGDAPDWRKEMRIGKPIQ